MDFDTVWKHSIQGNLGTEKVKFISLNHLIQNKIAGNRSKDLADVELLKKIRKE
ncbi:MAG: hypothetical protein WD491_12000 [Balneolales bacterium]